LAPISKRVEDLVIGDITLSYGKVIRIGTAVKNGRKALKIHFDSGAAMIYRDMEHKLYLGEGWQAKE